MVTPVPAHKKKFNRSARPTIKIAAMAPSDW
jgi:hypothetical protein